MKFATLVALVASSNAARIMAREKKPAEPAPVELAETEEGEAASADATAEAEGYNDYDTKAYNY